MTPVLKSIRPFVAALVLWAVVPAGARAWPEDDAKVGADNHQRILAEQGGAIGNVALAAYVDRIGQAIADQTELAAEPWTFTVTDTPVVNAFAVQGGYIYVTRGLLALANTEAELAAVLGHEIAHLTARHHDARQERGNNAGLGVLLGTVIGGILGGEDGIKKGIELSSKVASGYVATFTQKQEFEADVIGTRYLAAAGYNPMAQADILGNLGAKQAYEAARSGTEYNPNRIDFFASHPATGDRIRKAERAGLDLRGPTALRDGEGDYMAAIDGMYYGDSPEQGYVRGKSFFHPVFGFEYSVPDSFTITNSATRIVSEGPQSAQFTLDGAGKAQGTPAEYIRNVWVKQISRDVPVGTLGEVVTTREGPLDVARADLPFKRGGADWVAQLTLIRLDDGFIRLTGTAPADAVDILADMRAASLTFRALADTERDRVKPYRLQSHKAASDETFDTLLSRSNVGEVDAGLLLTLNGLAGPEDLVAGDLVKIVVQ